MIDANRDDILSREEFVAGYFEGEGNAARFKETDKDNDGQLSFPELLGIWPLYPNPLIDFCRFDADFDSRATRDELIAGAALWQKKMAPRLAAAFDVDGDGGLNLEEYQMSPFGNPLADWYGPRYDVDNDGHLSWPEFYAEKSPVLYGMSRHFFIRFDRDGDRYLSPREFDFTLDLAKAPAAAAFAAFDGDNDGRLVLNELVETRRPQTSDSAAILQWDEKLMRVEEAFHAADADADGSLAPHEFADGRSLLAAAIAGSAPRRAPERVPVPGTTMESPGFDWRLIGLIAGNVALLTGMVWVIRAAAIARRRGKGPSQSR
jgi:Ca2+-binding EF-hand superfamily protein